MQDHTVTLIVAVAGIAGTLSSGIVGQRMTRRSQREQWLLDNRKQECRELLSALSGASIALAYWYHAVEEPRPTGLFSKVDELQQQYFKANALLQLILIDRLFIAEEVTKAGIRDSWSNIVAEQGKKSDFPRLKLETGLLCNSIRSMATKAR